MNKIISSCSLKRWAIPIITGGAFFVLFLFLSGTENAAGNVAGYTIGLLAAVLHYLQATYFKKLGNDRFFSLYGLISFGRFAVILLLFISFILTEKIDQFSFTVSFLISYIYHSVIDIYLIKDDSTTR